MFSSIGLQGQFPMTFYKSTLPQPPEDIPPQQFVVPEDGTPPHFCITVRTLMNDRYVEQCVG
jgi:hypothetical protein